MATISTLAVNLIMRTSSFERGAKRSKKVTKSLKSTITGAVGSVARFAKGLALAAGIGGMGFLLKSTLSTLDAVSKLSRRLGVAHEALLGLRHAGELAGVSVQAMDKALETFTRRMGEVKSGSGEAKRGLEALGLSAERMIAMTPDKALLVVADRIETLGTQAEKAAAAYFLFGRAGAQMLNLFEQGAAGIEEAQKQAKELGITLEGYDLTQIEAANDAILSLKKSMTSLVQVATIRLAPALTKIAKLVTKNRDAITSTIKKTVIFIAKTFLVVKTIKLVGGAVRGLIAIYKSLAAAQTVTLALGGPAGWATLAAGAVIAAVAIVGVNAAIDDAADAFSGLANAQDKATSGFTKQLETEAGVLGAISKEMRTIAFFANQDKKNKAVGTFIEGLEFIEANDAKKRVKSLNVQLRSIREQKTELASIARAGKERIAQLKAEETSIKSVTKFAESIGDQLDAVGIDPLIAQLDKLERTGDDLWGEAWKEWNRGMDNAAAGIRKLIAEREAFSLFEKDIEDAKHLKKSILTTGEVRAKEIERVNELLAKGLITAEEQQKALAGIGGGGDLPSGRFQEIRSEFIDVAALNAGGSTQGVNKTNELLQDSISIQERTLIEIKGTATL